MVEDLRDLETEIEILDEAGAPENELAAVAEKIAKKETLIFLSGKYDRENAILTIHSGAGGLDAQDWGAMLLRMYSRYCQRQGFKVSILDESFGDGVADGRVGYKEVSVYIKGLMAYGYLKRKPACIVWCGCRRLTPSICAKHPSRWWNCFRSFPKAT